MCMRQQAVAGLIASVSLLLMGPAGCATDTSPEVASISTAVTDSSVFLNAHAPASDDIALEVAYEEIDLEEIPATGADAIWIAEGDIPRLTSDGIVKHMLDALERGKVIAFLTNEVSTDALRALGFPLVESTTKGNVQLYGVYVWEEATGRRHPAVSIRLAAPRPRADITAS